MKFWSSAPSKINSIFAVVLAIFFAGCTKPLNNSSIQVKIPWETTPGHYELSVIELHTLDDVNSVSGGTAKFYLSPGLTDHGIDGLEPKARVIRTAEGVYVPTDRLSQELFSTYAHLEKLSDVDAQLGIQKDMHWPLTVGVRTMIKKMSADSIVKDNAMYSGDLDSLFIVPFDQPTLPLTVNAGVLAHEHFHEIFYHRVLLPLDASTSTQNNSSQSANKLLSGVGFISPLALFEPHTDSKSELFSRGSGAKTGARMLDLSNSTDLLIAERVVAMRAINEGLADVWAWLYTGDANFIAHSLPEYEKLRSLDSAPTPILTVDTLLSAIQTHSSDYMSYAYQVGTQYARVFKHLSLSREQMQTVMMNFLDAYRSDVAMISSTDGIDTMLPMKVLLKMPELSDQDRALVYGVAPSLLPPVTPPPADFSAAPMDIK